jgi:uncharacterized membrane protein YeaQ/YmgE (transglycosylase-associated protein family)
MGIIYWIIVGLIAGWLAGQAMKGGGYGVLVDIILGMLGGIVGGWFLECSEFGRAAESSARLLWPSSERSFSSGSHGC